MRTTWGWMLDTWGVDEMGCLCLMTILLLKLAVLFFWNYTFSCVLHKRVTGPVLFFLHAYEIWPFIVSLGNRETITQQGIFLFFKVRLKLVVEWLGVVCISEVSFRFLKFDSRWEKYLEIWEGERIGSGSGQTSGFIKRDVEYFGYSTTTIEDRTNGWWSGRILTPSDHPHIKWGKLLCFENEQIDTKLYCLWLITARYLFRIRTERPSNLTDVSCGFSQSLRTNAIQYLKLCTPSSHTHSVMNW
jgi:hypothetical protein